MPHGKKEKHKKNVVFAKKLAFVLKEKKITQGELAAKAGISQGAISYYLSGDRLPDYQSLCLIIEHLDMPLEFWFPQKINK